NITARDLIITTTRMFIKVHGIPESPMSNLLIDNAEVRSRGLISIADAAGITLKDLRIESRDSLINILDGRNILFDSVQFNVPGGVLFTHVSGPLSDNIRFENTSPAKPANWKAKSWDRKDH